MFSGLGLQGFTPLGLQGFGGTWGFKNLQDWGCGAFVLQLLKPD